MPRICLVLLVVAVMMTAQQQPRVQSEAKLGAELAKDMLRRSTRVDKAEVQEYVNGIVRLLAQQFPSYALPFTASILEDEGSRILEPRTLPGGYLFVQASHILEARSEDELAGILAHAMAHLLGQHGVRLESAKIPLIFFGPWDGRALLPSMLPAVRQFHLDADRIAVQVMADAGYDPRTLAMYIGRTQKDPGANVVNYAWPRKDERLAELRKTIEALPARAYTPHEGLAKIQETLRASLP